MIECAPALSAEVLTAAAPALSVPVPKSVTPSLKVTVPLGTPVAGAAAETIAVNVTDCPVVDGFSELTRLVVVAP